MESNVTTFVKEIDRLELSIPENVVPLFYPLFQKGFQIVVPIGISLRALLTEHLGLVTEYINERIQTIFINHDPVDDLDKSRILRSSKLAFSGAMPGLAGAVFRRGGKLACMRQSISHKPDSVASSRGTAMVTIKVYNILLDELVPSFLRRGVCFCRKPFLDFVPGVPISVWDKCSPLWLNGRRLEPRKMKDIDQIVKDKYIEIKNIYREETSKSE